LAQRKTTAISTEGSPWDVAWAAVYLASDESRWMTRSVVTVDGGSSMLSRSAYTDEKIC
jgi:NAD(P)-dependent dehydrogenase (short-subunit alcohol dehydrogenase family)